MQLKISNIINDSIVDGKGIRMTIFTQGCFHHCPECHNPQTHSLENGTTVDISDIIHMAVKNPLLDGITLSGGDPFIQAQACSELAKEAHKIGLNVWTYTGYTYEELLSSNNRHWKELLYQTDILVDGRFEKSKRSLELVFKGSSNQRIIDVGRSITENKLIAIG